MDQIYLDKRGDESNTSSWVYYRVTSVDSLGNPAGTEGSSVQICRVKWPTFEDIAPVIDTPGQVGYRHTVAYPTAKKILAEWDVDHEQRSILIGSRER
jgi:hypothetical protein